MEELELWLPINGYNGIYEISNTGLIKSVSRCIEGSVNKRTVSDRLLKPSKSHNGYLGVILSNNAIHTNFRVNRLVAQHFIPNPENKPEVNHKDGNKLNNNVNNLEWSTRSENAQHAIDTGLMTPVLVSHGKTGALNHRSIQVHQYSVDGCFIKTHDSATLAEKETGINRTGIIGVMSGSAKTAGGYLWVRGESVFRGYNN